MNKVEKLNEIFSKPAIMEQVSVMDDPEQILAILAENGLDLTAEELNEVLLTIGETVAPLLPEGELSEDDLDNVAGGGGVTATIVLGAGAKFTAAILGGLVGVAVVAGLAYCGYKLYKKCK